MIYDLCVDNKSQIINHKSLYLIFNVTIVITARMIPINQNRTTIFDSGTTLKGFCIKACIPALPGSGNGDEGEPS